MSNQQSLRKLRQTYGAGNVVIAEAFVKLLKIKQSDKLYPSAVEWALTKIESSNDILTGRERKEFNKDNSEKKVGRVHKKIIEEIKQLYKANEVISGIKSITSSSLDQPISSNPLPNPSQSKELDPEIKLKSNVNTVNPGESVLLTWTSKNALKIKKSNIPGVTTKSPVNGSIEVKNVKRRRNFYISVMSSSGKTSEARLQTLVTTKKEREQAKTQSPTQPTQDQAEDSKENKTSNAQSLVSPTSRKERKSKKEEKKEEESKSNISNKFTSLNDGILLSINKSLVNIIKLLSNQLKSNQKKLDKDRISFEQKVRAGKEEEMEEKGPSGIDMMKSGVEKILSPFQGIIDKIVNFLFYTFLGRAFTEIVNWLNDPQNKEKVESISKFIEDFWPLILGAALFFFTPLGGFITGTVQFLVGTVRTLGALGKAIKRLIFPKKPPTPGGAPTNVRGGRRGGRVPVTTSGGRPVGPLSGARESARRANPFRSRPKVTGAPGPLSGIRQGFSRMFGGAADKITTSGGKSANWMSKLAQKGPISQIAGKVGGKGLMKAIPFIGAGLGIYEGTQRLMEGDVEGALLSYASGIPVVGWGALGLDVYRSLDPEGYKKNIRFGMSMEGMNAALTEGFSAAGSAMSAGLGAMSSGGSVGSKTPSIFSGLVGNKDGMKVSGAGKDTQAFPIMGGGMAVLQKGETVLQPGVRETIIKEKGIDVLSYNKGPNANKPVSLNRSNIKAMNTGGVVGASSIPFTNYNRPSSMMRGIGLSQSSNFTRRTSNYITNNNVSKSFHTKFSGLVTSNSGINLNTSQDSILMRAEKNEYVIPRIAVKKVGVKVLDAISSLDPNFKLQSPIVNTPRPLSRSRYGSAPLMLPPITQGSPQGGVSGSTGSGTRVPSFSATPKNMATRIAMANIYGILTN